MPDSPKEDDASLAQKVLAIAVAAPFVGLACVGAVAFAPIWVPFALLSRDTNDDNEHAEPEPE